MALNLYTSNRLEILARQCGEIFRRQPLPPLEPEIVVVQSRGMARWLAMEMAGFLTVWANAHCPFPNRFVAEIFNRVLSVDEQPAYERGRACWQLMALLAELRQEPAFRHLAAPLDDPLHRFQLAGQLADLFDQYIIYRPDLISSWENGGDGGWQALLWQRFVSRHGQMHRAALLSRFLQALRENSQADLPGRVTLFGISSLPPFHLEVFHALSEQIPVNLFFMNPCRHWWGDILPEREIARRVVRQAGDAGALYLESGNPLLASMGHVARDFLILLQERDCLEQELFEAPDNRTLLASIQRDILDLTSTPYGGEDDSVVIHSCHSPMREVEVLQDQLLALFAGDPALSASDIIVMAPDIEPYIPLVQAVFGLERDHPRFIPFSLADKGVGADSMLIDTFFGLLDMAGSRCPAREVVDMVQRPLFAGRFGFSEADCAVIKGWVRDVAIRWGRDGSHKEELGLPPYAENTWRAGLDRLLLGYAMADRGELFAGILPFGHMVESDADLLGRLLEAIDVLFGSLSRLSGRRQPAQWAAELQTLVDDCLRPGPEQENDMQALQQTLQGMAEIETETGFHEAVELRVINSWLQQQLRVEKSPHGFLSGGVTFCSLLPMRAIPFQVVCLLGMNDGDFPRPHFALSFDLMSRDPRRGDRSPRHDDRFLFLEALLSARRQLSISYVGQSARDDTTLPPSVLVSELLDYMAAVCPAPAGQATEESAAAARFVTRHRLQPFHPAYFQPGSALFSYAPENCSAAQRLAGGPDPGAGFWCGLPLPPPASPVREIEFTDFIDFFLHPVRFFCRRRLGVELAPLDEVSLDNEPFTLAGLPRYQLASELLDHQVRGERTESPAWLWKARGMLPHGRVGDIAARELQDEAAGFYQLLAPHLAPLVSPPVFRIAVRDFLLCGTLDRMTESGLLYARPARLKGRDLLRAWIAHLVANQPAMDMPCRSVVVVNDATVVLAAVPDSAEILARLVDLFWQGQRAPLPFFAETSWNYARWAGQGNPGKAWKEAQASWRGVYDGSGEGDDVYLRFRYQGGDGEPLDQGFADMAMRIFGPLLARMMNS